MPKQKKARILLRMQKKEISAPEGKTIRLKPLIEGIAGALSGTPEKLSEKMGIPFMPEQVDVKIFDEKGFRKAVGERCDEAPGLDHGAEFFPETGHIYLDAGYGLETALETLSSVRGIDEKASLYMGFLELVFRLNMTAFFYHELAHLNHCMYMPEVFESITSWKKIEEKEPNARKRNTSVFQKTRRELAVVEGVACWVDGEMMRDILEFSEGILGCGERRFSKREPSDKEKADAFFVDSHSLGQWFVAAVAKLVGVNPVRLVIDNPPLTLGELFNPGRYVERLYKGE